MLLLDRVIEAAETRIVCEVTLQIDSPYCDGAAVPGWVGIEYMAQAIGTLIGWRALEKQLPVKVGFLVGTRRYQSHVPQFHTGDILRVTADEEFMDANGLAMMRCTVRNIADIPLAEASLLVFQPDDLDTYLQPLSAHENPSTLQ